MRRWWTSASGDMVAIGSDDFSDTAVMVDMLILRCSSGYNWVVG